MQPNVITIIKNLIMNLHQMLKLTKPTVNYKCYKTIHLRLILHLEYSIYHIM